MSKNVKEGKFISLVLRHRPETIGIKLDENGWADVGELLQGLEKSNHKISMDTLEEIVATNDKKRYSFNEDKTKIRANQGHSINVDLNLKEQTPPSILYHGTAEGSLDNIKKIGLTKRDRNHVHLSLDVETAIKVGKRHGNPIILTIDAKNMHRDGYKFYLSENGVWLTEYVPVKYILV